MSSDIAAKAGQHTPSSNRSALRSHKAAQTTWPSGNGVARQQILTASRVRSCSTHSDLQQNTEMQGHADENLSLPTHCGRDLEMPTFHLSTKCSLRAPSVASNNRRRLYGGRGGAAHPLRGPAKSSSWNHRQSSSRRLDVQSQVPTASSVEYRSVKITIQNTTPRIRRLLPSYTKGRK